MGTETWLDSSITNAEIFPQNYVVYRKDRNRQGGGVFVAIKDEYVSTECTNMDSDREIVWASIQIKGSKDLYVGSYYRPPPGDHQPVIELEDSLSKLPGGSSCSKLVLLGGDFNLAKVDWEEEEIQPGCPHPTLGREVIRIAADHTLSQMNHSPTRGENNLDLIFTSHPALVKNTKVTPGISDHDIVVMDIDLKAQTRKTKPRKVYLYKRGNLDGLKDNLTQSVTDFMTKNPQDHSVEDNWSLFKDMIISAMDRFIPSRQTKTRHSLPWITPKIKRGIRRRQRLYNKAKKGGTETSWREYKQCKHNIQTSIRQAHSAHVSHLLEETLLTKNSKPFWHYIKSRKQDNAGISPLKRRGVLVSDNVEQADILNEQFQSVFTNENVDSLPLMDGTPYPGVADLNIDVAGVEKLLQNLNPGKASGPDNIPNRILKCYATQLAPMLTFIFNQSVTTGCLPKEWTTAHISPIFKKGDRHLPENYRPVSLTSVACKVLEHIICRHMLTHLEHHDILTSLQHGFRRGHSCESQLLVTVQDIFKQYDDGNQVDVVILDFSKAFDVVPHQRLLLKLDHYGIRGNTHAWIKGFLSGRTQRVMVNGEISSTAAVTSGVPQGTVLGPLLFLCYINDLPLAVKSQVRLFADDCLLYRPINCKQDQVTLQEDLASLQQWAEKWLMKFNPHKCYMLRLARSKTPITGDYSLCATTLVQVSKNPYLGVLFSEDARWGDHINKTVKKANSTLGFLRRNLRRCPSKLKELSYNSLVRSGLEYASIVWDPHLVKDVNKLEAVQRRAARFVCSNYDRHSSVSAMMNSLGWSTLQTRRRQARLTMLHRIIRGPSAISPEAPLQPASRRTRSTNSHKLQRLSANTSVYQHSFFPRTIPEWNALPQRVVDCETVEAFKAALSV